MKDKFLKISSFVLVFLLLIQVTAFTFVLSNTQYQAVNIIEEEIQETVHLNYFETLTDLFYSIATPVDLLNPHDFEVIYTSNHQSIDTPPPEC